jgi:hypothetical protein
VYKRQTYTQHGQNFIKKHLRAIIHPHGEQTNHRTATIMKAPKPQQGER